MSSLCRAAVVLALISATAASAAAVLSIDEEKKIFVSVGLRASGGSATALRTTSGDVSLDAAILSLGGQWDSTLKISLNGGRAAPNGELRILDAFGMWEPKDWFKIWVGRFLVPTDRATLTGPFFSINWDAPSVAAYPAALAGRSDGITIWGHVLNGSLKYYAGVFRRSDVLPTKWTDLLSTARIAWSPLGAEPAYYANGSYFGSRRVLTIAAGTRVAPSSIGPVEMRGDLWGWNVDVFFEHPLGPLGVLTVEAALYRYYPSLTPSATVPGGTATYEQLGWIPPLEVGKGRLQFVVRHQHYFSERGDRLDGTVNFLLSGHFLRFALTAYGDLPRGEVAPVWGIRVGAQLIL